MNGRHQSHRVPSETKQNLNPAQEAAVNEWVVLNSSMATPLHPRDLRARAFEITGKTNMDPSNLSTYHGTYLIPTPDESQAHMTPHIYEAPFN